MFLTPFLNQKDNKASFLDLLKAEYKNQTIQHICENQINLPQISVLARNEPESLEKCLAALLVDLNESLGVKRGLNINQVKDIVEIFPLRFPYLRLNDFYLICQYIKSANLEGFELMDRLDTEKFFLASKIYERKKGGIQAEFLEKLHSRAKSRFKDDALNMDTRIKSDLEIIHDEQKRHDLKVKQDLLKIRINNREE